MFIDADKVKNLRLKRQWSQDELAVAAGLSRRTIQRVETESSGSLQTLKSLASVFLIQANELQQPKTKDVAGNLEQKTDSDINFGLVRPIDTDTRKSQASQFGENRWFSRKVASVTACVCLLVAVVAFGAIFPNSITTVDPALEPGMHQIFIKTDDGLERSYHLHVPSRNAGRALPLMIVLFGPRGSMNAFQNELGFEPLADREGFLIAYPEAIGSRPKGWNTNLADYPIPCCGEAGEKNIDDVGFMIKLKYDAAKRTNVDLNRVFVFGKGPGGHFGHRLMCEAADEFHAFAFVNGYLNKSWESCTPSEIRPIKGYHGRHNTWIDIDGCLPASRCDPDNFLAQFHSVAKQQILSGAYQPLSFQKTYDIYAERNQCAETSTALTKAGESVCQARDGCSTNAEVEMCVIDGGHFINTHTDIHVAQDVWEFFSRY